MEFNLGWKNLHDSRGIPPEASSHSPFADQTCQVCYMGPDFRRNQHEVFHDHSQAPPVHPHPHHMHGGIREIEKEIITEEIIMAEIARKRALEAEVWMIERQLTLLRRDRPFLFHPSPRMNHDLPTRLPLSVAEANWSSLEEKLSALLEETKKMNGRHENPLPLHGGMEGLGNQETKCFDQGVKDNKNTIFLAKKDGNISESEVGPSVLPKTDSEKRNNRDEWSCALCEVTASSEETLNEHLHEKKHNLNIDSLRRENARKKYNIGLLPKTAINSSTIIKTVNPLAEQEAKVTTEYFFSKEPSKAYARKQDSPLQAGYLTLQPEAKKDENVSVSRETDVAPSEVGSNELPKTDTQKNNIDQWSCGLGGINATSEQNLNVHLLGKKHQLKLDDLRLENFRKNCCLPKKVTGSATIIKNTDRPAEPEAKLTSEYFLSKENKRSDLRKQDSLLQSGDDTLQPEVKRDESISGSRETASAPSEVGSNELPKTDTKNNNREQWICVICKISATREQDLNEHLHGKKHKLKLDALQSENARKNCRLPKKATKPTMIIKTVDPPADQEEKLTTEYFLSKETKKAYARKQDLLFKAQSHTLRPEAKKQYTSGKSRIALATNEVGSNDRYKWSCALCKVNANSEQDLNWHLHGKKHKLKFDDFRSESAQKNCSAGLFPKKATKSATMTGTVDPPAEQESKLATEYFVANDTKKAETRKQNSPLQPGNRTQQPEAKKVDICGTRSMAGAAHEVASNGLPKTDNPTRNDKDEWSCAIHEVNASTEEVLNEGIVDKGKLEASRSENTQKKCYRPENATKSTTMIENVDPHAEQEAKHTTEYFLQEEPNKLGLSKQYSLLNSGDLTALQPEAKNNDISGSWRMSFAAHEVDCNELPETGNTEKNDREDLSCALREVSASTEGAPNESMYLKEQKCKFDTLRSENGGKCWLLKNVTESAPITETVDPPAGQETKLSTDYLLSKQTKEADLRKPDSLPKAGDHSLQPEAKKDDNSLDQGGWLWRVLTNFPKLIRKEE